MATKEKVSDMKPYLERALKDEDVRESLMSAFAAAREIYDDLLRDRSAAGMASRLATDKDLQENLRTALEELRHAADRVQAKEDHSTRNTLLLLTGIAIGVLFNPVTGSATRQWINDRVFGPSDDFTYSGTGGGDSGSGAPTSAASSTASST